MFCSDARGPFKQSATHKSVETADLAYLLRVVLCSFRRRRPWPKPRIELASELERSFVLLGKMFNSGRLNQKERTDGDSESGSGLEVKRAMRTRGHPEGYWSKLAQIGGRTRLKVPSPLEGQAYGRLRLSDEVRGCGTEKRVPNDFALFI